MKPFMASTVIAVACVSSSYAAEHVAPTSTFVERVETQALRASDMIGQRLYASETAVDPEAGLSPDWQDIGEIEDVIVGDSGGIDMIIAEIGGFLGLGEHEVALDLDALTLVPAMDAPSGYILVVQGTRSEIENAPAFDNDFPSGRTAAVRAVGNEGSGMTTMAPENVETVTAGAISDEMGDATMEGVETDTATLDDGTVVSNPQTPATAVIEDGQVEAEAPEPEISAEDMASVDADTAAPEEVPGDTPKTFIPGVEFDSPAPEMDVEGYTPLLRNTLRLPELQGVPVFDTTGQEIGDIAYAYVPGVRDSETTVVVVSIGGFLGIGDREVAMQANSINFMDGPEGVRAYVDASREELEALPEYER